MNLDRTTFSVLLALVGRVPAGTTPGLDRLLAEQGPDGIARGIAVFDAVPTGKQVCSLEELGLTVQPMQFIALADVAGRVSAMQAAVAEGIAKDIYLDERPQNTSPRSTAVQPASRTHNDTARKAAGRRAGSRRSASRITVQG